VPDFIGGAEEDRTPDLCSAIAALSHLSYGPKGDAIYVARSGIVKEGRKAAARVATGAIGLAANSSGCAARSVAERKRRCTNWPARPAAELAD
jgi:hypothetical protein